MENTLEHANGHANAMSLYCFTDVVLLVLFCCYIATMLYYFIAIVLNISLPLLQGAIDIAIKPLLYCDCYNATLIYVLLHLKVDWSVRLMPPVWPLIVMLLLVSNSILTAAGRQYAPTQYPVSGVRTNHNPCVCIYCCAF